VRSIKEMDKRLDEREKEIERLKNDIKRITEITNEKIKIINDVREYIEKHIAIFEGGDMLVDMNIDELLEILDRVGDKE